MKENNKFELDFDKSLTKLSGFDLGKDMFDEQIKGKISYENEIEIVIPERVDLIGSSFIQGFFEDIVNNIGISGVEKWVNLKSAIPNIKEIVMDNLL